PVYARNLIQQGDLRLIRLQLLLDALLEEKRQARPRRRWPGERKDSFDADIVRYLVMVVTLIESRRVSEAEIRKMLARAVSEHRIARRRRIDYLLHYLENNSS